MAKDYAKFVPPRAPANNTSKWRTTIIVAILLALLSMMAVSVVIFEKKALTANGDTANATWLTRLVASAMHKKPAAMDTSKPKVVVENPAPTTTVHFDFYDALPTMKMPAAAPVVTSLKPKPLVAEPKPKSLASYAKSSIFNPEEVTHLLAAQVNPVRAASPHYVVQVGVFETESGARRLVEAINSIGFQAKVVKINHAGLTSYHVQQGPFDTMAQAKLSQQHLRKRGIISIIHKLA